MRSDKLNETPKGDFSPDKVNLNEVVIQRRDERQQVESGDNTSAIIAKSSVLKDGGYKVAGKAFFNNYQLSWLKFNWRVLELALNPQNPLLERVKFIGITCSNLDEFFQKRVGGLKRQIQAGFQRISDDGYTPHEQLKAIRADVKKMISTYRDCFLNKLVPELAAESIKFVRYADLNQSQRKGIDLYFNKQLYPILTPLAVDNAHPFPFISNQSRSLAVELEDAVDPEPLFARIKIPTNRPRWLIVSQNEKETVFVSLDDLIKENVHLLFPGMKVKSANVFRVTRSADIERNEEEAEDLLELIEDELRERRFAEIVRLEIEGQTPAHVKALLKEKMHIVDTDVFEMDGPIGLADCMELYGIKGYDHLRDRDWVPTLHPVFKHQIDEEKPNVFSAIKKENFLVHHPYHSFQTSVQRFIEEAAEDPKVLAIKQTLYRTSKDSPIMHALMRAADNGKQVAVLVELKARFDEERNIEWAQKLEKAGVHVAYGLPGLKIHTKVTVVVREERDGLKRYCHIGTGNYNPSTASLYEDLGLFTCDETLGADASDLFNFLTGYAPDQSYRKLVIAPRYMRRLMLEYIEYETEQAKAGKPARVIAKMNSLEDHFVIQRLYEASQAGVKIDLIVRGVCRLVAGEKGLSENISVHSILGRFLEHSRVFYFQHGGEDLYFIGSADWMHRNLDARVEALVPVEHPKLKQYLQFLLNIYLKDNKQRWILFGQNQHKKIAPKNGEIEISTQEMLMEHHLMGYKPIPRSQ